ncbi:ankyrin repeat-containing domain protein [Aspergillus varians]
MPALTLFDLPSEILLEVARCLSTPSLASFCRTCKLTNQISTPILYAVPTKEKVPMMKIILWFSRHGKDESMAYLVERSMNTIKSSMNLQSESLITASGQGFTKTAKLLLDAGIPPNVESGQIEREFRQLEGGNDQRWNWTCPLMAASLRGHFEIVQLLVSTGIDFNRFGPQNIVALYENKTPDYKIYQYLIDNGLNINHVYLHGNTLLHEVFHLRAGNLSVSDVAHLLDNGLDPARNNNSGYSPLYYAIHTGEYEIEVVTLLLDRGAQADQPCGGGLHPLHVAATASAIQVIHLLLQKGVDPNARDAGGMTPISCIGDVQDDDLPDQVDVLTTLLNAGASLTVSPESTSRLLLRALLYKWEGCVDLIRDSPQALNNEIACHGAMFLAVTASGDVPRMKQMLKSFRLNVNASIGQETALIEATKWQREEAVKFLIPLVSNFHSCDLLGRSAWNFAMSGTSETIVRRLLPHVDDRALLGDPGAPVKRSALMAAFYHQPPNVISSILNRMQAPSDKQRLTRVMPEILYWIVAGQTMQGLDLLLDYMVSSQVAIAAYDRPLLMTMTDNTQEGFSLKLIKSTLPLTSISTLLEAAAHSSTATLKAHVKKGVDLNKKSRENWSAIAKAVQSNLPENVKILLQAKVNVAVPVPKAAESSKNVFWEEEFLEVRRENLLRYAASYGYTEIVKIFLHSRFNVNAFGLQSQRTVLMCAARNGHIDTVRLLLDHHADIHKCDRSGATALFWACLGGHSETAKLLLNKGAHINASNNKHPVSWTKKASPWVLQQFFSTHGTFPGCAILTAAVYGGSGTTVQLLLDRGANKERENKDSQYLLHLAAHRKAENAIKALVQAGWDPTNADQMGYTPVRYSSGHGPTISSLLTRKA